MKIQVALLLLCAIPASLFGQAGNGAITGTVVDNSNAVIPGARVTLLQMSTKATRDVVTNEQGIFNLPSIVPGEYKVTVKATGFRDNALDNIVINGFQELSLGQLVMTVGTGPATQVTVTAEQQLIKDSGERIETIQANQVSEMPNNGRNWATLLKVIPGSVANDDQGISGREYGYYGYQDYTINGKPYQTTQINLDGGSIVDHGSDGKVTVSPSLESIQEISVLSNNFTAEYGNRSGAVINIVSKSGTNTFHGVAFESLRNEAFNANSWSNNYIGLPKPMYRYNYYGANIGGPIKKNKVFFFYNFENFKQNIPGSIAQARVPSELERIGDFSKTVNALGQRPTIYVAGSQYGGTPLPLPGLVIPPSQVNPLGKAILALYPLPNNTADLNNNYNLVYQALYPRLSQVAKVDYNISNSTRMYLRYSNDGGTNTDKGIYNSGANIPFNLMHQYRPDRAASGNITHTFSSSVVFEGFFSWSYDFVEVTPADMASVDTTKLGLSGLPTSFKSSDNILPGINVGGTYPTFNFNRLPAFADANEWQTSGTVTWTKGTHTYKFGGQFLTDTKQEITAANNKGNYDFSASHSTFDMNYGPANALTGALAEFTQVSSIAHKDSIFRDFQLFAQDSYRIKRNLTLNYGIRMYHMPAEHDVKPSDTMDAVFLPWLYDPAKAPRYYIPNPANKSQVIDPANPSKPLSSDVASTLLYSIVPGSGSLNNGVMPLGAPGIGDAGFFAPRYFMFAPRGGFAYTPAKDSKMVIRGGFGWAYNRNLIGDAITNFNNGLTQSVDYLQTSLTTLSGNSSVARISPQNFTARDPSTRKAQTVYDYSVSVQHEIPLKMVLDVAYVGNLQRHQAINFNLNAITPGTAFQSQYVDSTNAGYNFYGPITASNPGVLPGSNAMNAIVMRPYKGINTITDTANVGNNRYDSMQISINKRFGHGLTFQGAFSKNRLLSGVESPGLYSYIWKQFTGYPSNSMRGQNLSMNYVYQLPNFASKVLHWNNIVARSAMDGWQFAHVMTFLGGQRYTPSFSIQESNTGTGVSIPNVFMGTPDLTPRLGIGSGSLSAPSATMQFNPAALTVPAIYPQSDGTGPRNFLTAPGTFANDMTLSKKFVVKEGKTLEFKVSAYNAFNQVRRTALNTSIQYKAQGANFSNGFAVYNTPDQLLSRVAANTNPVTAYNQYRTGVGYYNITSVQPMRVVELGLKFRF